MKYLLSLIILVLLSAFDFYNPKGFNYQAIVRDASGNIKKNANVTVAFDIVDQSDNALYSESHSVTTNDFGIINLVIGKGSTSDDFSIVDWTTDELSIKVTLDGTVMGTSPLLSVPYANYANNGITTDQADAITANTAKVGITSDQTAAIETNSAKVGVYIDDSDNTVAGKDALSNKSGLRNTAIGKDALRGNKDGGDYNTAVGYYSMRTNTTGTGNAALGNYSLQLNTEGKNNTASGKASLQYNTTGDNNTAMGSGSLNSSTEASNSAALGYNALKSVTTGNANTSVGATAGDAIVTGIQNTVMGYNSGGAVTSGGYNVLIGANAGSQNSGTTKKAIIGGSNNTLVGTGTAVDLPGATNRTVIGKGAIGKVNNSVTLGNSSVTDVYAADDGDAVIHAKGITYSDGTSQTTAVTQLNHLSDVLTGENSVYLGGNPSSSLTEGFNNVSVGSGALGVVTSGRSNSAVGAFAMSSNTTGLGNVAVGQYSLTSNISGDQNVAVGMDALYNNVDGCCNTALGRYALRESSKNYNTSVGYQSMRKTTEGGNNSALGVNALFSQTEGDDNVAIGNKAMYSNTTGSYNVAIGSEASISSTSGTNQTVIGYNATGKGDNTVVLGNGNITDVYAAEDGDATVHAKGITFSDGTTQTTAVSESKVTFNQVMTTGFTDTDNVLEIGDLVIRVNNNYLEWKVNSGTASDYFDAIIIIQGTRAASNWGSLDRQPNYGDANSIRATNTFQEIVDRTDVSYQGGKDGGYDNNPGLWYYKMVEIELFNNYQNESYKITAYGYGSGRATIKGEYWNFK